MSISAMKQALEALDAYSWEQVDAARTALKQAIEFEEMVKKGTKAWDGTPDDWVDELRGGIKSCTEVGTNSGVLRREWVGLTDEDITQLRRDGLHSVSDQGFRAIEAKLREKNT